MALAWTMGAKWMAIRPHHPASLLTARVDITLLDVAFFAALFAGMRLWIHFKPGPLAARGVLLIAIVALGWSVLNAAWLIATGVQLQPGILAVLAQDPAEFWPMVESHLIGHPAWAIPIAVTLITGSAWLVWRLIRPRRVRRGAGRWPRAAIVAALVSLMAVPAQHVCRRLSGIGFAGEVLGFSSHWYALASTVTRHEYAGDRNAAARVIPHVGERQVIPPSTPREELPNVVMVLLESEPYVVTSLGNPELDTTPTLARLASEGAEFVRTHVPCPQTTKAWWAAMTGSAPDTQPDYAEAILADAPYESLPSILARVGYRSAFFQMCKGTFECAPGLFDNLAFDWAFFRENLEDPSAHLGYMAGDDFRLLDPAFCWATREPGPFFLLLITSVSHDPYELPAWYTPRRDRGSSRFSKYLTCIELGDHYLDEVCKRLEAHGLAGNTLLCVMGDHGESFRPEQSRGRFVPFEEVIRVPWVLHWPGRVPAGQKIDWPCSQLDATPTILTLLGFDVSQAGFEGRDAFTPADPNRRIYFSSWIANSPRGYLEGPLKWIYWPYNDKLFGYGLDADPEERAPTMINGAEKDRIVRELAEWEHSTQINFPARRFRKRFLFDHWHAFSSGRSAWAYYVP